MGLVFVAVCLAVFDFWATRKYWMARYKELKTDHELKLQRDLAVYRQQKLNARAPGLKPPSAADDTATVKGARSRMAAEEDSPQRPQRPQRKTEAEFRRTVFKLSCLPLWSLW